MLGLLSLADGGEAGELLRQRQLVVGPGDELGVREYVLVFEFDGSGEKIKKMVEWVDSVRAKAQVGILFG